MLRIKMSCDADEAIARLDGMINRSRDFRPVFRWAKQELQKANAENFTANGLPVGGWSPLSAKYGAWKAVNFPGAPIMVQTGKLRQSLTNFRGTDSRIDLLQAEFGTSVDYAKFHQYGTTRMPKRKIMFVPDLFAKQLAEKAADHVVGDGRGLIARMFR